MFGKSSKKLDVTVSTWDSILDFSLKQNSSGHQLFSQVCAALGIREMWYFGLEYQDSKGRTCWVRLTKKMSLKSKETSMHFKFRVKYYPEEVSELIQEITRLYFFYDVKESIVSGRVYCPADTALLLAAHQALYRYGKYDSKVHTPGFLDIRKYIPEHILKQHKFTDEQWEAQIVDYYASYGDMPQDEAIINYLKIAQDLEMFGVTYFPIKNPKQTELWLGVDALGLNIYKKDDKLTPKVSFPWNEIHKLSYNHEKFTVKPVESCGKSLVLYTESTHACKCILDLSTGNHELYAIRRRPDSIEVQQMKAKEKENKTARELERGKLLAEREARELMEKQCMEMKHAMQENEQAHARTRSILEEYENKVHQLQAQLEDEILARKELEAMQRHLENVNERLKQETAASNEERIRLASEREKIMDQIEEQRRLMATREEEKRVAEAELARVRAERESEFIIANEKKTKDTDECEFRTVIVHEDVVRQAMADTDLDHAQRLNKLKKDLDAVRDRDKMTAVDIQHEQNARKGMDKYRTLRAIREGNTKKRVDQFESM